ncbi:hypothetical protein RND81_11G237200 [Saponaria officinalis]|uniref:J domain-containing protein n=1 Tax=Saponaria officinalis TaxID=3572 RepID=A0AAW1HQ39_SAPOF
MERVSLSEDATLEASQLLNLADTHLRLRNFSLSRQYSLELLSSPSVRRSLRASATQILTLSDVLSAADNHYSVLQLDSFSSDHNLIRTQFKKLTFILQPIKHSSPLANEALVSLQNAFDCLSDSSRKADFDAHLVKCMSGNGAEVSGFWTFCPYCFYVYEYDRVYEGCSLRCQNCVCRRVFHGVALTSLPKMELDKGLYFGCFGYFPIGFSPAKQEPSKFESWSPIVSMFPSNMKPPSSGFDLNHDLDGTNFIEILDESDESEAGGVQGASFEGNVPGVDRDRPRGMRRKSAALNARRKRRSNEGDAATSASIDRLFSDEGADFVEDFGMDNDHGGRGGGGGDVGDLNEGDMAFFEGDGEIFVGFGSDD